MGKVRVLIVDDSVAARRLVSDAIAGDPDLEVIGTASNGKIGLERVAQLAPDVVTLDVEMPVLNGLQTLEALRRTNPKIPVIMFSPLTEKAAAVTLDALALGATAYATKPTGRDYADSIAQVRDDLVSKIKLFGSAFRSEACRAPLPRRPSVARRAVRVEILAMAASTGGPNALHQVVSGLPRPLEVPLMIVQHMPPVFTKVLGERLGQAGPVPIAEGISGRRLELGQGWIAPGNFHMTVARRGGRVNVGTNQEALENSCRPSADVLFRSVAEAYGENALAVVLTGMGRDGLRGCEAIKERGGQVIVQDEASSVVWGMPGFVARAGLADEIVPLGEISEAIARRLSVDPFRTAAVGG